MLNKRKVIVLFALSLCAVSVNTIPILPLGFFLALRKLSNETFWELAGAEGERPSFMRTRREMVRREPVAFFGSLIGLALCLLGFGASFVDPRRFTSL